MGTRDSTETVVLMFHSLESPGKEVSEPLRKVTSYTKVATTSNRLWLTLSETLAKSRQTNPTWFSCSSMLRTCLRTCNRGDVVDLPLRNRTVGCEFGRGTSTSLKPFGD